MTTLSVFGERIMSVRLRIEVKTTSGERTSEYVMDHDGLKHSTLAHIYNALCAILHLAGKAEP